jgi:hypothetical protein
MTNEERDEAISEIRVAVAQIASLCPICRDAIKEYHYAIDGNGSRGIKVRVANLELQVKWIWVVIGSIFTAIGGVAMVILECWLK